jgi:CubicO group peptidase (beta-lactamase class C family)
MRRLVPVFLAVFALVGCHGPSRQMPPPPPGISHAWVTFDASGLTGSGVSGLADRGEKRVLTIDDPVRIASVSKLVVALGVMRLVEQGRLSLDEDLSKQLGWPLRNPAFPDTPLTLRLLLSHRASLTDDGGYVVPLGKGLREAIGNPNTFDAEHAPGTYFRYANLGFPIIASVLEKATGERFDRLMKRLVLEPLGLDACFNWSTCSDAKIVCAVVLYDEAGAALRDDLRSKRPDCPVVSESPECDLAGYGLGSNGALFSPQGGLRISARDLAALGQLLLNRGLQRGQRFLSEASIDTITRPAWRFNGANGQTEDGFYCSYGLATQILPTQVSGCGDDLLGNGRSVVGHAGDAYGVRSGLWIDASKGVGIAYFAANNGENPERGRSSYRGIEEYLAAKLPK